MKKIIYSIVVSMIFVACNDYLDTVPSKGDNEVINRSEQIEALLNNSSIFNAKTSVVVSSSDDIGLTIDMLDQIGWLSESYLGGLVFSVDDIANNQWGDEVWEDGFKKVFTANLILNDLDNVEDLNDQSRQAYIAEARFMRAMANWNLVQTYCVPYAQENLNEPGLPLKQSTDYEESMIRSSIQDTYAFILADLQAALETPVSDVDLRWRVSKPAVQAMLARYYLFTQDYAQAAQYAQEALKSTKATLQDYNSLKLVENNLWNPSSGKENKVYYSELYQYAPNQMADYQENYYSQYFAVNSGNYLIPSESLIALYDQENDLRFKQFFVRYGLWDTGLSGFGDDILYCKFKHYISGDEVQSGPTVPEMLLTAAEALARQNKVSEAMQYLNKLRRARIRQGAELVDLSADSQDEAISLILEERHREMPFVMRWFDIRRLAFNETTADDVTVERTFYAASNNVVDYSMVYKYTLPVKSKRYAIPLTNLEITRSGNQLVQNNYTDGDILKEKVEINKDEDDERNEEDWNYDE